MPAAPAGRAGPGQVELVAVAENLEDAVRGEHGVEFVEAQAEREHDPMAPRSSARCCSAVGSDRTSGAALARVLSCRKAPRRGAEGAFDEGAQAGILGVRGGRHGPADGVDGEVEPVRTGFTINFLPSGNLAAHRVRS